MTNPGDAVGTNGGYGGRTSVNAFNDVLSAFSGRGIIRGWACLPKTGMTISLGGQDSVRDVAIVENDIGQRSTLDNISTQPIDITLNEAPTLGSRIDAIVGYVTNPPDSSGELIDSPDACGLIAVESSVTTTPTAPNETMIREAITADGGSGVNAYYAVLATIKVGTGVTTITNSDITSGPKAIIPANDIEDGSITAPKLAQTGMYSPTWHRNFAVSPDTPAGWNKALGGHAGRYWNYYSETGNFAGQPMQYGFLETIIENANIVQYWHSQDGYSLMRVGNASGWLSDGWVRNVSGASMFAGRGNFIGITNTGAPIYQKIFKIITPSITGSYAVVGNIGTDHTVVSLSGVYLAESAYRAFPNSGIAGDINAVYYPSNGNILLKFSGSYGTSCPGYINVIFF